MSLITSTYAINFHEYSWIKNPTRVTIISGRGDQRIDFYKDIKRRIVWMYALRNVTSSRTVLTTDQRGQTVESNRTWLHRLSLPLADPHYRRRNWSIGILGNSSLVHIRNAIDRFSSAEFHRRVITQFFVSLSFSLSFLSLLLPFRETWRDWRAAPKCWNRK